MLTKKIKIPRIGGDVGQGIARCIRERYPAVPLVGEDINPNCGWRAFTDSFVKQGRKIKAINFPYAQTGDMAKICDDKLLTNGLLTSHKLPAPYTTLEKEFMEEKAFVKPRWGWGGHGTGIVYQALLKGKEITVPAYVTQQGETRLIQLERTLVSGTTSWARVINNPLITEVCKRTSLVLGFKGAFNIQLMLTKKGPKIFEINPRFSSTVYMRHCLGFEDAIWALEELMGWELSPYKAPKTGTEVVRVHGAKILCV